MSASFKERVVWITGASSGIGEALAEGFARSGAKLILSARRVQRLEALATRLSTEVKVLPLDLCDAQARQDAVAEAVSWKGRVDILVNNAGISQRSLIVDTELATVRKVMEINFFAVVALTCEVLPHMLARGSGHVVSVSSVAGYVATPMRSTYAASKHALRAWSDALRAEMAGRGIDVTVICPGYVRTEISQSALRGDGSAKGQDDEVISSAMSAERAAGQMLVGIARRRREVYVGGNEIYAIYLQRWMPGFLSRFVPRAKPS